MELPSVVYAWRVLSLASATVEFEMLTAREGNGRTGPMLEGKRVAIARGGVIISNAGDERCPIVRRGQTRDLPVDFTIDRIAGGLVEVSTKTGSRLTLREKATASTWWFRST